MAQNKDIKELEKKIIALEQEKTQLLKLVSHDVKSPFNKLFALSNLLQMVSDNLNEEQLDYLNRMEWVINEGLAVVRNLMDLRAIENDAVELSIERINFEVILEDNFKNYAKHISTKNIVIDSNAEKVTIWSDKRLLERVIGHLVSNAIKFTPKKSTISINLTQKDAEIKFKISTNSGPIPDGEIKNIFKRSSPLSTRPTHGESALGNGLFIAQNYAKLLGGFIEFSQSGSLVEFKLRLPDKMIS